QIASSRAFWLENSAKTNRMSDIGQAAPRRLLDRRPNIHEGVSFTSGAGPCPQRGQKSALAKNRMPEQSRIHSSRLEETLGAIAPGFACGHARRIPDSLADCPAFRIDHLLAN